MHLSPTLKLGYLSFKVIVSYHNNEVIVGVPLGYGLLFYRTNLKNLKIVRQQRTTGDHYAIRR